MIKDTKIAKQMIGDSIELKLQEADQAIAEIDERGNYYTTRQLEKLVQIKELLQTKLEDIALALS